MPQTFDIPNFGKVNFPDDASQEEIQHFLDTEINSKIRESQAAQQDKPSGPEAGFWGFAKAVAPTAIGTAAALGAEALLAPETGGASLLGVPATLARFGP